MIAPDLRHAFTRIQIEFIEMPDLKLTLAQVRRLCDLPQDLCEAAMAALLEVGFLWRTQTAVSCAVPSAVPAGNSATRT